MVFYTYFKDRDEIMRVLVEREKNRINEHFANKLSKAQTDSAKSVISELVLEYVDMARAHPKLFRLFWLDTSGRLDDESNRFNHLEESFSSMTRILKIGMDKGEFTQRPARLTAATVMSVINGPIVMQPMRKASC